MVELEDFPGRVGVGEGGVQEVDLHGGVVEAGGGVGVFVDGCALERTLVRGVYVEKKGGRLLGRQ